MTKKLDEGTLGGFAPIPATVQHRELNDFDKWMAIVSEAELETETEQTDTMLTEQVVGDLQNGYDRQHKTTKNHSDYFPNGADSNVVNYAGPASGKSGDNPLQKADKNNLKDEVTESKEIHKELVYEYRKFKNNEQRITESVEITARRIKRILSGNNIDPSSYKITNDVPGIYTLQFTNQYPRFDEVEGILGGNGITDIDKKNGHYEIFTRDSY